jgi:hypothetical protein
MPALDRYESVASGLYVKLMQPVITDAGPRRALIYVGRSTGTGQPRPGYLEGVTVAARALGLPQDYIGEIEQWLPRARGTQAPPTPPEPPRVRPLWAAPGAKGRSGGAV